MRIAFAGTPEFAATALTRIHDAGFDIALVLTQPDRPAGRGMKLQTSPVKRFAEVHGLRITQPRGLRLDGRWPDDAEQTRQALIDVRPQAIVVAAYGLLLPRWVLERASVEGGFGCFNIHASLLPRWRGAAPIHRAIEAGDAQTGITIMQMDAGLDTGDMLLREAVAIEAGDSTTSLHDRLAGLGARLVVEALEQASAGTLTPTPQPFEGVSYAHKIDKAEAPIDWSRPAVQIERRLRAFDPAPGCSFVVAGTVWKCWRAEVIDAPHAGGTPGTVINVDAQGPIVACGEASLRLLLLQRPGGKRVVAAQLSHETKAWLARRLW